MKNLFKRREIIVMAALMLLLVLITVAVKLHQARVSVSVPPQPSACQTNLYLIDQAVTLWALAENQTTTNYPTSTDVLPFLNSKTLPVCPNGGAYHYGTLALATSCEIHGHSIVQPPVYQKPSLLQELLSSVGLIRIRYKTRNYCIANLKQMDGAAQQWALENKLTDADSIHPSETAQYLKSGQFPICPHGGKYWFNIVSNPPYCTVNGHTLP
ncbi:MAG: hypothetical protein K0Q55_2695 [Verrucomicrobia bacterium]|jgi:hypothetical protein|nr:hypothetical protein [Verrucomicrobiota bacterium]